MIIVNTQKISHFYRYRKRRAADYWWIIDSESLSSRENCDNESNVFSSFESILGITVDFRMNAAYALKFPVTTDTINAISKNTKFLTAIHQVNISSICIHKYTIVATKIFIHKNFVALYDL